ncbi:MAG TPA: ABC transporter ATP-binding protein [Pseudonocardiaceae bacterium]|nr:ABC transporter ATP-binding protein [Pseudonocardiaceae bacterium]
MSANSAWPGYLASLRGTRKALLALAGWSLVEGGPALVSGRLVAMAVDDGFGAGKPWTGVAWLGVFGAVALLGAIGSRFVFARLGDVVEPVRDALVTAVVRGVLHGDLATGHRADASSVARITRHVEVVRDVTAGLLVQGRSLVVTVVAAMIGLLDTASPLAVLVLPPVVLALAAFTLLLRSLARRQRELVLSDERCGAVVGSLAGGLRDVLACGGQRSASRDVAEAVDAQAAASVRLGMAGALRGLLVSLGGLVPLVLVLAAAPRLVADGRISAGAVLGAVVYLTTGVGPALVALGQTAGTAVLRLVVTLRRLADVSLVPEPQVWQENQPAGTDILVRGLTFGWGVAAEPVVRDLDLRLPAGRHVAVVGASGIGKSTLAGLLTGLLPPAAGVVLLGGVDVGQLRPEVRRELVALIPQESYVFTGTLRENLALLATNATDAELTLAAQRVGAGELLAGPDGLDAKLGHGGVTLSSGERQLVALARVYASTAKVVVLDEATAHLDPATEAMAEQAFAERGGTLVVIAHRLSSAIRAELVLMMDGGRPVLGSHAELLTGSPGYAELMRAWTGQVSAA